MSSYEALYRKYRPRRFADLVGQGHISATLANAISDQRLAHAYLFTGPRGTGKTSTARIFAKSLNCEKGPTVDPCDQCPSCEAIRRGHFPDVIEIDAASHRGVDDARDLRDRVRFAPTHGRYKVFIIDEVHMLTNEAFNALLKTIEEPPPNLVFILATTDVHKVLPTIVSRCQRFDFRRIPLKDLIGRLASVAEQEGFSVDPEGLAAIARRADGGLRDALSLLDQVRANAMTETIDAAAVYEALGLVAATAIHDLVAGIGRGELVSALAAIQDLLAAGFDHPAILRELTECFRHLMLLEAAGDRPEALDIPELQVGPLRQLATAFERTDLLLALDILRESEAMLKGSNQMTIWLEMAMFRLVHRRELPSLVELSRRVAALEERLEGAPSRQPAVLVRPAPPPPAPAAAAAPPTELRAPVAAASEPAAAAPLPAATTDDDLLEDLLTVLHTTHRGTHSLVQQTGSYLRRTGSQLVLGIKSKGLMAMVEQRKSLLLQAAIQTFGQGVTLSVELDGGPPARPSMAGAAPAAPAVLEPRTTPTERVQRLPAASAQPEAPAVPERLELPDPLGDEELDLAPHAVAVATRAEGAAKAVDPPPGPSPLIERAAEIFSGRVLESEA